MIFAVPAPLLALGGLHPVLLGIGGIAGVITGVAGAWKVVTSIHRWLKARHFALVRATVELALAESTLANDVAEISTDVSEIRKEVGGIARAVNHVSPGTPPIKDRVARLESNSVGMKEKVDDIHEILVALVGGRR